MKLSESVWEALDAEAEQSQRSTTRQLETILRERYGIDPPQKTDVQKMLAEMKARLDILEQYAIPEVALKQIPDKRKK